MVAKVFSRWPSKLGGASAGIIKVSVPPRFGVSAASAGMPSVSSSTSPALEARCISPPPPTSDLRRADPRSERELIAAMRRPKAKRLVKSVRIGAALVRDQLDQTATAVATLCNRPIQYRAADAAASLT